MLAALARHWGWLFFRRDVPFEWVELKSDEQARAIDIACKISVPVCVFSRALGSSRRRFGRSRTSWDGWHLRAVRPDRLRHNSDSRCGALAEVWSLVGSHL